MINLLFLPTSVKAGDVFTHANYSGTLIFSRVRFAKLFLHILIFFFLHTPLFSQVNIQGRIVEENDGPIPFASIKLMNRAEWSASDSSGNFSLQCQSLKKNDTLLISSVGYDDIKISAIWALNKKVCILKRSTRKMEPITLFSKEDVAGSRTDGFAYFRSWSTDNIGGEIGRAFQVPYKEYQVARVRFKIYSSCDTCIIRLHIRNLTNNIPGDDLLKDSVSQVFIKANVADKIYGFDLDAYNLILYQKNIFISFELLKGTSGKAATCSLAFVGSETGSYLYKSSQLNNWDESNDYSIFMKASFRHN